MAEVEALNVPSWGGGRQRVRAKERDDAMRAIINGAQEALKRPDVAPETVATLNEQILRAFKQLPQRRGRPKRKTLEQKKEEQAFKGLGV